MLQQQVVIEQFDGHARDVGCEIASNHLGRPSRCRWCPFDSCVKDIRNQTKQLLKNNEIIETIFKLDKQGKTICEICEAYPKHSPFTIKNWLAHQRKIKKTISQYKWAIPYLNL